jgi:hypothetical protein
VFVNDGQIDHDLKAIATVRKRRGSVLRRKQTVELAAASAAAAVQLEPSADGSSQRRNSSNLPTFFKVSNDFHQEKVVDEIYFGKSLPFH